MVDSQIFIVGANGQLGTALREQYPGARSADISELNITNAESVDNYDWSGIDVILNAAAYTNVDGAETAEGRAASWGVNATAVANLAKIAQEHGITLVHISSDYVFDGTQELHDEAEPFSPLSVYGQSKAAGDIAASLARQHYIVRTSWVIGQGKNFVGIMKNLANRNIKPSVVDDQIGRLTFTPTLAAGIKYLIDSKAPYGTYNLTNDGQPASWADIAKIVYEQSGKSAADVAPVSTADYYAGRAGIAPRPLRSTLSLDKIKSTGFQPSDWAEELEKYLSSEPYRS